MRFDATAGLDPADADRFFTFCREQACDSIRHVGGHGDQDNSWEPYWSPSGVPSFHDPWGSHAMSEPEIEELIAAFIDCAIRDQASGFDGVDLFAAYNCLLDQFWSPLTNKRTDKWGGDLENRLRFTVRVAEGIRTACGADFIVGMSVTGAEPYPGGLALSALADKGRPGRFRLPRPMLNSGNLDFSFSGLKTAVLTLVQQNASDDQTRADIAAAFQEAIVEVLVSKSAAAVSASGLGQLVVAGGVGANRQLREALTRRANKEAFEVYYPPLDLCTDNGAMIAYAGALRLAAGAGVTPGFTVRARWDLASLPIAGKS